MSGPEGMLRLLLGVPRRPGRTPWEAGADPLLRAMRERREAVARETAALRAGASWDALYGAEGEGGDDGGAEGGDGEGG